MKDYFLIVDTETTQDSMVADFGAIVVNRKGEIVNQCAVLVHGIYDDMQNHPLFFTGDRDGIWSKAGQDNRYKIYRDMLANGSRMMASVPAINRWLEKAKEQYNPILTAYNLPFDLDKCKNTGIDLLRFDRSFCLWGAAFDAWAHTKEYRKMALTLHAFNAPTGLGNMTYKTNAETMTRFVLNVPELEDEPHTALEDAVYYELPILVKLLKKKGTSVKKLVERVGGYDWRKVQVRDWFTAS